MSKDVCKLLTEEMRNSLDLPKNETSVEEGSQIEANQSMAHQEDGNGKKGEKETDDLVIIALVRALIMGETLMDDDFLTAVEEKFFSLSQAGGLLGHFIWKNSAQYSRPRRLVIARAMTFAELYEGRGFVSNVRRIIERLRAEDANS